MSISKDAEIYNMNHKNRGKFVIFNHEKFDGSINTRVDSSVDVLRLQNSFSRLEFDIEIENDLIYDKVMEKIEALSIYYAIIDLNASIQAWKNNFGFPASVVHLSAVKDFQILSDL